MGNPQSSPGERNSTLQKTMIYYSDDEQYVGEVKDGLREGFGTYSYTNGDRYEGAWVNNMKQGLGYFYYNNGELYIGQWVANKKNGFGKYFYLKGDRFEGEWRDNNKNGKGSYYYIDGTVYEGEFKDSKKHGKGQLKMADGRVFDEVYEEGECIRRLLAYSPVGFFDKKESPKMKKKKEQKLASRPRGLTIDTTKIRLKKTKSELTSPIQEYNNRVSKIPVQLWTTDDVLIWLDKIGYSIYKDIFNKNHIDGSILLTLTDKDLEKELGITDESHREEILKDLILVKALAWKSEKDGQIIHKTVLSFYEKNISLFVEKSKKLEKLPDLEQTSKLKDVMDSQDTFIAQDDSLSSSGSSSENDESDINDDEKDETRDFHMDIKQIDEAIEFETVGLDSDYVDPTKKSPKETMKEDPTNPKQQGIKASNGRGGYLEDLELEPAVKTKLRPTLNISIAADDEKDSSGFSPRLEIDLEKHKKKLAAIAKKEKRRGSREITKKTLMDHTVHELKRAKTQYIKSDDQKSKGDEPKPMKSDKTSTETNIKAISKKKFEKSDGESSASTTDNNLKIGNELNKTDKVIKKRETEGISKDPLKSVLKKKKDESSMMLSEHHSPIIKFKDLNYDLVETINNMLSKHCLIKYNELTMGEKLGEGGYGEVKKAVWFGKEVAVKSYDRKKITNKRTIDADFIREVEMLQKIRHPNIVLFIGVSVTPDCKGLLVTEFVEQGSLFDHLHKHNRKFTNDEVISIAREIALGMCYLHSMKILHCDLKSSNILIDAGDVVKIGDFGLSSTKQRQSSRKKFKRLGTPHWMAPEVMRAEEYDESSDVYSYGMILWELITNKIPYIGLKITQIVGSVGYGDKQIEIPERGNKIIIDIMKQCLNKDRKMRPDFQSIVDYLENSEKTKKENALKELDNFFG